MGAARTTGTRQLEVGERINGDAMLVGRDAELVRLETSLNDIREHGGSLIIRGEPGIGKTSLLSRTASEARSRGYRGES